MGRRKTGRKQANLIAQGGIMAVVLLLTGMCVLLRQIPLTVMWGDKGNSIYAAAYGVFSVGWLIASYGLPMVLARLLKPRLKQGQYKNAGKVIKTGFLYATITGAGLGGILFLGSTCLTAKLLSEPLAALMLQFLAPTVLIMAWNSVLRGFFLGNGSVFPVAVSLLLEQIVTLAAGFTLAGMLREYGTKVGALLQNEDFALSFAGAGFAAGIGAGAVFSLLFLLLIYMAAHAYYKRRNGKDSGKGRESMAQVGQIFFTSLFPMLLCGVLIWGYLLSQQICFKLFMKDSLGTDTMSRQWGMYYGKYKIFTAIPLVLTAAMGFTLRDKVRNCRKKDDYQHMRELIQNVLQAVMTIVIPLSVMLGVLAVPILNAFFAGQDTETASALLLTGFVTAVFFSAAYLLAEILLGMQKTIVVLLCGAGAFAVYGGAVYVMLEILHLDIFGILYADIIYSFCLLLLLGTAVQKKGRFRAGLLRGQVPAAIAAVIMGVILFLLSRALTDVLKAGILLGLLILTGTLIYFILLLLLRGTSERILYLVPGGRWVCMLAKVCKLI